MKLTSPELVVVDEEGDNSYDHKCDDTDHYTADGTAGYCVR